MGSRMLRRWLSLPLKNIVEIKRRHEIVDKLIEDDDISAQFINQFKIIGDLERLISKVATLKISPRECGTLKNALYALNVVKEICHSSSFKPFDGIAKKIDVCVSLR